VLGLTHIRPYRAAAVLGVLVLSEAPRYGGSAHTSAFHAAPAVAGTLLILPGFLRLVTRPRRDVATPAVTERRRLAWRTWGTLLITVALFAVATIAGSGVNLRAPLTLCIVGLLFAVTWTATGLAVAMLRQDLHGPLLRLRWLTVTPGCLLGPVLSFLVLGDTWATLLFGCFSTGLGALLCDLWTAVPQGTQRYGRGPAGEPSDHALERAEPRGAHRPPDTSF
jgi:hypothetical protein